MLEDDPDRRERFARTTRLIDRSLPLIWWDDAHRMVREFAPYLGQVRLISLDHDLEPLPGETSEPGDGLVVVKALTSYRQPCPVIIHSSNRTRSEWMGGEFELAGWQYHRVAPIGDRWIEEHWRIEAAKLLRFSSLRSSRPSVF